MKRLLLTIAAAASVAGPMALTATEATAQDHSGRGEHRDRDWDRSRDHDRGGWDRDHRGGWDRGDRSYRNDHWDRRDRWDHGRHNGYYYNSRWYYGPPPSAYHSHPSYRPGYSAWRRGAYLPNSYRGHSYIVTDYYRYNLRSPPRGYNWYRTGNDYVLAAIATGLIFDVVAHR
jgi:Ni/Co efflux regulator RcnB